MNKEIGQVLYLNKSNGDYNLFRKDRGDEEPANTQSENTKCSNFGRC